ncbi:50S ribosomal protein L11 methyltransferase [Bacteroides caecigallinarum]|uniref:50S ribosomal protein L11 methyltransferase n=1 Tax=Bacteroides sp. ET336 TaxID=2972459 RepID=UPI0021ACF8BD|nr:50S ribosomal protein L11 methyltransferase [Bacteroides sp. ET336]MCR8892133.1 50S ribosomal protein L11 methyltransferase [Bacteroides sp. ET336]MDN0052414.1 50S ribosomal protein L11 methyltransferase [Bacteroides caecigallinarum]MDN0056630.1 50S ribosomal protein L11 methyltransferase [Bacteroides caecigallinarum]
MKYFEVTFSANPCNETITDILSALTAEIGFESFVECEGGMQAYIQQSLFDEEALKNIIADFPIPDTKITYTITEPEDKDWNEEWEKNFFQPIVIEDRCVIHSTFHKDYPKAEYDIVINPQMAFGTGHHETTSSILGELLDADLKGKSVLDMGCGTSILAILASMRGADPVTAIDIDDWCVNNSRDNIALNNINNITVELGDASLLEGRKPFDVIIANINRNILLNDMAAYTACMHKGSEIYMSGFYVQDIDAIRSKGESLGLKFVHYREKNNWAAVKLIME